jgi:hypothetical protein
MITSGFICDTRCCVWTTQRSLCLDCSRRSLLVVFRRLDVVAFEAALTRWAQARAPNERTLAIDGKGLYSIHGEELRGVRLVAAYCDDAGLVLAQMGGPDRAPAG